MKAEHQLFFEELGTEGRTIVFLPGLTGTTAYWKRHVAHLAANNRLILIDPLGFGNSPKPNLVYSVERHVAELHNILKDRERITLVGHSFGSILATAFTARYPELIDRLVLISLPYFGSAELAAEHFKNTKMYGGLLRRPVMAAAFCIFSRRVLGPFLPYLVKDMHRDVLEDLKKHTWRSFSSTFYECICGYDLSEDLEKIPSRIPVMCLHGDRDATAPIAGVRDLVQRKSGWEMRVMEAGGHHPLVQDAEWCLAALM